MSEICQYCHSAEPCFDGYSLAGVPCQHPHLRALFDELEAFSLRLQAVWRPIETAPKTGPCKDILLFVPGLHGTEGVVVGHWAHGGGEEQPLFGPAWFFWRGHGFAELFKRPTHWMPLPSSPESKEKT